MCTSANVLAPVASERVHYFSRQLITADDMRAEQEYFRQKLRRHNRYLHGWGVVCGCAVEAYPKAAHPWQVRVCPGYLITPQGDEILISDPVNFDVAGDSRQIPDPCANPSPCSPAKGGFPQANTDSTYVYLAACYTECETRPVRVHPVGCACDESACDYSRIRDSFELMILPALPADAGFTEGPGGILCPAAPGGACVVLARIQLPTTQKEGVGLVLAPNMPIKSQDISYGDRRILRSVMELPTPPTIVKILPSNGESGIGSTATVQVTFDRKMDIPNNFTGAMTVDGAAVPVSLDATGTVMSGQLPNVSAGTHVIKVLTKVPGNPQIGVKDLCGTTIVSDYTWTFGV